MGGLQIWTFRKERVWCACGKVKPTKCGSSRMDLNIGANALAVCQRSPATSPELDGQDRPSSGPRKHEARSENTLRYLHAQINRGGARSVLQFPSRPARS